MNLPVERYMHECHISWKRTAHDLCTHTRAPTHVGVQDSVRVYFALRREKDFRKGVCSRVSFSSAIRKTRKKKRFPLIFKKKKKEKQWARARRTNAAFFRDNSRGSNLLIKFFGAAIIFRVWNVWFPWFSSPVKTIARKNRSPMFNPEIFESLNYYHKSYWRRDNPRDRGQHCQIYFSRPMLSISRSTS